MATLIPDVQQIIAYGCVGVVLPLVAIVVPILLMRQLRWLGFRAFERED